MNNRQIHLDFHTGPAIPDVGADFDAEQFADTMHRAHVNSVTLFAKCHHGHLYYNTDRPERHPGLKKNLNLLAEQITALHHRQIRTPIYISVQCDEYAANTHPEWVARNPDTSQVKWGQSVFTAGWQILDLSSPYQDYLAEQTREILQLFKPVDGIFFDMCWDQPSTTQWALAGMGKQKLNPEIESDRKIYARNVAHAFMKRFSRMVRKSNKSATVYFNSRPLSNLADEIQYLTQTEIEALPSGGWGYMYFPKNVRYARTFNRPYLGMTARFHKSWADFGGLKPHPALEYETSQMIAHGAGCSIGDQLHPRGRLNAAAYDLIGSVYKRVEQREPWLEGAKPVTEIAVLFEPATADATAGSLEGATRMLTQLKHQFDLVTSANSFDKYTLLILPDSLAMDDQLLGRIRLFVKNGGAVLATGTSGLTQDATAKLLSELPIKPEGFSSFSNSYIRFSNPADLPDMAHVMYERPVLARALRSATNIATIVEPYFQRSYDRFSSHFQTPPARATNYSAAAVHSRVGYSPYPLFGSFARNANRPCRWLIERMLDRLLPEPLIRMQAPMGAEATLARQGNRLILHVLYYIPERRTPDLDLIEDIVPLHDIPISVRCERGPSRLYIAPTRQAMPFHYEAGRIDFTVPKISGHAMIVMET